MSNLDWAIVLGIVGLFAGDAMCVALRDWRARRRAARRGRTLTAKFGLLRF